MDTLHGGTGHTNCAVCHNGPPQLDNVIPLNCVVCHPLTDPGECNLVRLDVHQGNTCLGCHDHFECRDTTTTTTAPTTTPPSLRRPLPQNQRPPPRNRQPPPPNQQLPPRQEPIVMMMVSRMIQITAPAQPTRARKIPIPREAMASAMPVTAKEILTVMGE